MKVQVRVHAALFPNVRLLAVSEQSTRSATLTVVVTHPGTNAHNCCLTSNRDLTTIFPLSYWYSVVTSDLCQATYLLADPSPSIVKSYQYAAEEKVTSDPLAGHLDDTDQTTSNLDFIIYTKQKIYLIPPHSLIRNLQLQPIPDLPQIHLDTSYNCPQLAPPFPVCLPPPSDISL